MSTTTHSPVGGYRSPATTNKTTQDAGQGRRKVVTVTTGEASYGVDSSLIRNVLQASEAGLDESQHTLRIGEETIPVFSLRQMLVDDLGLSVDAGASESSLLLIQSGDVQVGLRAQSVSRPVEMDTACFFRLPPAVYRNGSHRLLESLLVRKNSESSDHQVSMQLILDPVASLTGEASTGTNGLRVVGQHSENFDAVANRSSGQVVLFAPAGVEDSSGLQFCLPLASVAEVIRSVSQEYYSLPQQVQSVDGFVMWRNIPVPVVNLARVFQLTADHDQNQRDRRLVVCRLGAQRYVAFYSHPQIMTLKTPEVISVDQKMSKSMPALTVVETEYGMIVVPDLNKMLG